MYESIHCFRKIPDSIPLANNTAETLDYRAFTKSSSIIVSDDEVCLQVEWEVFSKGSSSW